MARFVSMAFSIVTKGSLCKPMSNRTTMMLADMGPEKIFKKSIDRRMDIIYIEHVQNKYKNFEAMTILNDRMQI